MKKNILSVAILVASLTFIGCSDDDNDCKTCNNIANISGLSVDICDNGDGTADVTSSFAGESATETIDIPDGESVDDLDCSDFEDLDIGDFDFDFGDLDL